MSSKKLKAEIIDAALQLSIHCGYHAITRLQIAQKAKCAESTISYYFKTMKDLKKYIMREAIKRQIYEIVAQGLALKNRQARLADEHIKEKAQQFLLQ